MFKLAKDFTLPSDAITQTFAVLAKRGVGKTYTAMKLTEQVLQQGFQCIVADPVGVWWGLRSNADGSGSGLPIVVLGGEHGDLPLESTAGSKVAELVVKERVSVVLDLSLMRKGAQVRFMVDFCEALYHKNRQAVLLLLDEADAFAPQKPLRDQARLLGAVEDLVRRGRARGIGVVLISQRAAVLNKNVLTQTETLIAMRTLSPQDRAAVKAWVEAHDVEGKIAEMMETLATLKVGEAWIWSPAWLNEFRRIKVAKRETFDSSATPKVGARAKQPKQLAPVDLKQFKQLMKPQLDPTAKRLATAKPQQIVKTVEKRVEVEVPVEVPVLQDAELKELRGLVESLQAQVTKLTASLDKASTAAGQFRLRSIPRPSAPVVVKPTPSAQAGNGEVNTEVSKPQQRILDALAAFEQLGIHSVRKGNVAVWAGQSPKSSGFTNNLGRLRSMGFISYPTAGEVGLTPEGRAISQPCDPIASHDDLHQAWLERLSKPKARILSVLIGMYPNSISKAELAEQAEQSINSSGYTNNLGNLRSLGIIDYPAPGFAVATELLFPQYIEVST